MAYTHLKPILPTRILIPLFVLLSTSFRLVVKGQKSLCRTACGNITIDYPFGIDDGCGNPFYRLTCTSDSSLEITLSSGTYVVQNISYSYEDVNRYIQISDPSMWTCDHGIKQGNNKGFSFDFASTTSFALLEEEAEFLFLDCDNSSVLMEIPPSYGCSETPWYCPAVCDNSNQSVCSQLQGCQGAMGQVSCCKYRPRRAQSLEFMLQNCKSYTIVYGGDLREAKNNHGIRFQFSHYLTYEGACYDCKHQNDIQVDGVCGYDPSEIDKFICLCEHGNSTGRCRDGHHERQRKKLVTGLTVGLVLGACAIAYVGCFTVMKVLNRKKQNEASRIAAADAEGNS